MSQDEWSTQSLEGPARRAFAITPTDATLFENFTRAIYVGAAGNITLQMVGGSGNTLFSNVPAGTVLPIQAKGVDSTGTTASLLIGLL